MVKIAKKHGVDAGTVLISFAGESMRDGFLFFPERGRDLTSPSLSSLSFYLPSVKRNIVVLPKSVTPSRIKANLALVDLDAEDMKTLLGLSDVRGVKRYTQGAWGIKFGFEDGF